MAIDRRLLSIIGRRFPAIFDVIPRGPQISSFQDCISEVALNPQRLPPHELGETIIAELIRNVWLADHYVLDHGFTFNDLDDWCPTRPRKLKLPVWWPPFPESEPHPNWFIDFHLGFAARIAAVSSEFNGTRLGELFNKAIDRSLESIESVDKSL